MRPSTRLGELNSWGLSKKLGIKLTTMHVYCCRGASAREAYQHRPPRGFKLPGSRRRRWWEDEVDPAVVVAWVDFLEKRSNAGPAGHLALSGART